MFRWSIALLLLALACLLFAPPAFALPEENGVTEVTLIRGLDGGDYEAYAPAVVKQVQAALKAEGYYSGEENGILDEATMKALGEFQKENGLTVSGVPTPMTRERLLKQ